MTNPDVNNYVRDEYQPLSPGTSVVNSAGDSVGTVGGTVGNYVELRGGNQTTSYWIRRDAFGESQHEGVLLGLTDEEFSEHALTEPPEDSRDSASIGVLEADADEQRELMLKELAEQRAEMREEGRATEEADDNVGVPVEQELKQEHR